MTQQEILEQWVSNSHLVYSHNSIGLLAPILIRYLVTNFTEKVRSICEDEKEYPLAVACIHVMNMLFELLDINALVVSTVPDIVRLHPGQVSDTNLLVKNNQPFFSPHFISRPFSFVAVSMKKTQTLK